MMAILSFFCYTCAVRKSRGKKKKASQEEDGDDIPAPKTRKLKNRQSTTGSPPSAIITDKKKKTKLSPLSKGGNKRNPHGKSRDTQLKETDAQDSGIKTEERYTPQGVASAKRRSSNTNKVKIELLYSWDIFTWPKI